MKCSLFLLTAFAIYSQCIALNKLEKNECGLNSDNFPFVVFIPLSTRSYNPSAIVRCAGVLLNEKYVLTSSHCLQFVLKTVQLGRNDISKNESAIVEMEVESWTKYDHADIALLKLNNIVKYTNDIIPACFPFKPPQMSSMYTFGWGLTSKTGFVSTIKKIVEHSLVSCKTVTSNTVCLEAKNKTNLACNGDEGSPVVYCENQQWVLYGILSAVFDNDAMPCAENDPGVAVLLTGKTIHWIKENIQL